LTTLAPDRPVALETIVNRLTAKRADERYQSASELRDALLPVRDDDNSAFFARLLGRFGRS
jgi:hypothetical protein